MSLVERTADRLRHWNSMIDAIGDVRSMSVLRIVLGPIVLLHFSDTFRDALDGVVYSDRFYLPYADWYPEAGRDAYIAILIAVAVSSVAMSFGFLTRLTTSFTAFVVGYHVFLSKTHFAHNRAFLLILLITLALLPVGRHYSIDAWWRRRHGRPRASGDARLWPIWLVRFEVVAVYCSSAVSKVIDGDWWGGLMMQRRAIDNRQNALDSGVPEWVVDLFADGTFQWWFSKSAVLAEFVIALGFLNRRTRLIAIWIAIPFHLSIQVAARVQVFSWAAIAALIIWVTPRVRERVLYVPDGSAWAAWVGLLDWFGRFEVVFGGDRFELVDDTGRAAGGRWTGRDAKVATLLRLPATFWFAAPWWVARRVRSRWLDPAPSSAGTSASSAEPIVAGR